MDNFIYLPFPYYVGDYDIMTTTDAPPGKWLYIDASKWPWNEPIIY